MKKNKKNKTLLTVLILLLAITIGYAAIATTLKINGSADVKSARWNVYWDENSIAVTNGSVETSQGNGARVTDAGKTQVEYSVELSEPGDFYEFTVDAVNEGSLNAKIAPNGVKNNVYESDGTTPKNLPDYLGYTVKYAENDADVTAGDVLEAKKGNTPTRKKYKVRVWYKTDIDPSTLNESTTETLRLVFEVDYVQGDKAPDPYSMASMCPGCNAFGTVYEPFQEHIGANIENFNIYNLENDYTNLDGLVAFDAMVLENNIIQKEYICGHKDNGQVFCLEGADESEFATKPIYEKNKDILNHYFSSCGMITDESDYRYGYYSCDDDRIVYVSDNEIIIEAGSWDYSCWYGGDSGDHGVNCS